MIPVARLLNGSSSSCKPPAENNLQGYLSMTLCKRASTATRYLHACSSTVCVVVIAAVGRTSPAVDTTAAASIESDSSPSGWLRAAITRESPGICSGAFVRNGSAGRGGCPFFPFALLPASFSGDGIINFATDGVALLVKHSLRS